MSDRKKLHTVKWDTVTVPKRDGGLGIRDSRAANIAHLAKIGSKLASGDNSIWAQVLKAKYVKSHDVMDCVLKMGTPPLGKELFVVLITLKGGSGVKLETGAKLPYGLIYGSITTLCAPS